MSKFKRILAGISLPFLLMASCATGPTYEGPPPSFTPKAIMAGKACQTLPRNNFGLPNTGTSWVRKAPAGMTEMSCGQASFYLATAKDSTPLTWTSSIYGHNLYSLHGVVDLLAGSVDVCVMSGTVCKVESYKVTDKPVRIVITAPQVEPLNPTGPMTIKVIGTSDKTIVGQMGTAESIS